MAEQTTQKHPESTQADSSPWEPMETAPSDEMVLLDVDGEVWPGFLDEATETWMWFDSIQPERGPGGRPMVEPNCYVNDKQPRRWRPMPTT